MPALILLILLSLSWASIAGQEIALSDQALLTLPPGTRFADQDVAEKLLAAWGENEEEPGLLGVVLPDEDTDEDWLAVVTFDASGYIKVDDIRSWNEDALLLKLEQEVKTINTLREKYLNLVPIEISGWAQKPSYNSTKHQLIWSALVHLVGNGTDESSAPIKYHTYVLGRAGYIELTFITRAARIEEQKPIAQALLDGIVFHSGKTYGDFDASMDKIAAYGLAGLVVSAATKYTGWLSRMILLERTMQAAFSKPVLVVVSACEVTMLSIMVMMAACDLPWVHQVRLRF